MKKHVTLCMCSSCLVSSVSINGARLLIECDNSDSLLPAVYCVTMLTPKIRGEKPLTQITKAKLIKASVFICVHGLSLPKDSRDQHWAWETQGFYSSRVGGSEWGIWWARQVGLKEQNISITGWSQHPPETKTWLQSDYSKVVIATGCHNNLFKQR